MKGERKRRRRKREEKKRKREWVDVRVCYQSSIDRVDDVIWICLDLFGFVLWMYNLCTTCVQGIIGVQLMTCELVYPYN